MATIKHIEIAGVDARKLSTFYSGLFGWEISRRDVGGFDYYDIEPGGAPSAGIRSEPEGSAEIVVYIEVSDLDASIAKARELGSKIRIPPTEFEGLRFALIEDPEGNPIGLTQDPTVVAD